MHNNSAHYWIQHRPGPGTAMQIHFRSHHAILRGIAHRYVAAIFLVPSTGATQPLTAGGAG